MILFLEEIHSYLKSAVSYLFILAELCKIRPAKISHVEVNTVQLMTVCKYSRVH